MMSRGPKPAKNLQKSDTQFFVLVLRFQDGLGAHPDHEILQYYQAQFFLPRFWDLKILQDKPVLVGHSTDPSFCSGIVQQLICHILKLKTMKALLSDKEQFTFLIGYFSLSPWQNWCKNCSTQMSKKKIISLLQVNFVFNFMFFLLKTPMLSGERDCMQSYSTPDVMLYFSRSCQVSS